MNTGTKLAAFAVFVIAVFGGAAAIGSAVGPIDVGTDTGHGTHATKAALDRPRGLAVADAGYRLTVESTTVSAGSPSQFAFRILDADGTPVTGFEQLHDRALHLVVLSRNLVDYLHLHPTMDDSGRWTVDLPALTPGSYRVFADFQPNGADNLTLGIDISVPGSVEALALPEPSSPATVADYSVALAGQPLIGDSELSFTVDLDGMPVQTDPYLGAAGHLIAIRSGDLAYLHVHPLEGDTTTSVTFTGEFPTAGVYRLFFDFSHNGTVHTAAFTVDITEQGH